MDREPSMRTARPSTCLLYTSKIGVITNLLDKVDTLIIGGGMAYTFMNALGYSIGTSICENDKVELAKDTMAKAKEKGVKFLIPVDNVVGTEYKPDTEYKTVDSDTIPDGWMGLDLSLIHISKFPTPFTVITRMNASGLKAGAGPMNANLSWMSSARTPTCALMGSTSTATSF